MIVSPTGTGKSYIIAAVHRSLERVYTVVPSHEIAQGIYHKMSGVMADRETLESAGIWTPIRLRNKLLDGHPPPAYLQIDEGHHTIAETYTLLFELCNCPAVCYTATPYRGSYAETAELRRVWGEPYVALTFRQAIAFGYSSLPDLQVWPLVNDETLDISNGEFVVHQAESAVIDVIDDITERIIDAFYDRETNLWHRPIIITCPGVSSAEQVSESLRRSGASAETVVGSTRERGGAFDACVERRSALVHVSVVGEGVDLPLRIMVDLAPTLSPVKWMQRFGRLTRPTDTPPLYVCTNHNLSRHIYLLEGCVPSQQVRDIQTSWGPVKYRSRAIAGLGRLAESTIPLLDGTFAHMLAFQTPRGEHQYAVLYHPGWPEPYCFERENPKPKWGRWHRRESPPEGTGYVSIKPHPLTDKMRAWWKRSAKVYGLDPEWEPDARTFQILPILSDCHLRVSYALS